MNEIKLQNWSVTGHPMDSIYTPPEDRTFHLYGTVYNHPDYENGSKVISSAIKSVQGREVTTVSGRKYVLGRVCPKFKRWCVEQGVHVPTREVPIKVK